MKYLLAIILIFSIKSYAYDLSVKYGLGVGMPNQTDDSEAKLVSVELQNDLGRVFKHKIGIGAWFDPKPELNRAGASFMTYAVGLKVQPGDIYIENFFGFGWISQTDSMLSTSFEFTEELGIGTSDKYGRFIGIQLKHFSNAGIQIPNKGRNFILINAGVEL